MDDFKVQTHTRTSHQAKRMHDLSLQTVTFCYVKTCSECIFLAFLVASIYLIRDMTLLSHTIAKAAQALFYSEGQG